MEAFAIEFKASLHIDTIYPANEKQFHKTRFEVLSNSKSFLQIGKYLRKYKRKRFNADTNTVRYFDCQRELLHIKPSANGRGNNLSLALVGDLMWIGKASPTFVSENVLAYLDTFDVVFGNLETPIDSLKRVPNLLPDYLTYNSHPTLINAFKSPTRNTNVFTAFSLANNHALDRGASGVLNTITLLNSLGIEHTGVKEWDSKAKHYLTIEQNGIRIGIYSATYGLNFSKQEDLIKVKNNQIKGISPPDSLELDISEICIVIRQMINDSIDLKIINLHWGFEFELYPDVFIQKIARQIVLAGADIILGGHPHVFQPMETIYLNDYKNPFYICDNPFLCSARLTDSTGKARKALVIYSLGNFVTRMYTPSCKIGAIASLSIFKDFETLLTDWHINTIEFVYNYVPTFPGKRHKLMLYNEFENQYLLNPKRKNIKIKTEAELMIEHIGKKQ
jgi:poly-gamma-glutamate capsule biosynthesis protein CapA/YwtB (metallophosphatase superfamily)